MYLRLKDYDRFIQADNLSQVISKDSTIRMAAESAAQEEIESQLKSKYNTDAEFTDTLTFSSTEEYTIGSRVQYDFDAYKQQTYAVGDLVTYLGRAFRCSTAVTAAEAFDSAKWTDIGAEYDLYYLKTVYPLFKLDRPYAAGDTVFYNGKIYTALLSSSFPSHDTILQAGTRRNIPSVNTFPGTTAGAAMWGTGVEYNVSSVLPHTATFTAWSSVTAYTAGETVSYQGDFYFATSDNTNKLPTAGIAYWSKFKWMKADNRSQQIVMIMIDIVLYHIHSRIAPKNIPELRQDRYDQAIKWLRDANKGNVTPKLELLQPNVGGMIRHGGPVKLNNSY